MSPQNSFEEEQWLKRGYPCERQKEVLRLYYDLKLSKHKIARSCNIAASTVREHLRRAEAAGIRWPLPAGMDGAELSARLFPEKTATASVHLPPPMEYIHQELRIKGVTT